MDIDIDELIFKMDSRGHLGLTVETVNKILYVLKKEKPKKVIVKSTDIDYSRIECPVCNNLIPKGMGKVNYCSWCGQKIYWTK